MKLSKNSTKINDNMRRAFRKYGTKIVDRNVTLLNVYNKHDGVCVDCKCKTVIGVHPTVDHSATIEHIQPLSIGGNHVWSNVELLCVKCNGRRNNAMMTKWSKRFNFKLFGFEIRLIIRKPNGLSKV